MITPRQSPLASAVSVMLFFTLALAFSAVYTAGARERMDNALAGVTIEGMNSARGLDASSTVGEQAAIIEDLELRSAVFIDSDAARRMPDVSDPLERAQVAWRTAFELSVAESKGIDRSMLSEVTGGYDVVTPWPQMLHYIEGTGPSATLVNGNNAAANELYAIARAELEAARTAQQTRHPARTPLLGTPIP